MLLEKFCLKGQQQIILFLGQNKKILIPNQVAVAPFFSLFSEDGIPPVSLISLAMFYATGAGSFFVQAARTISTGDNFCIFYVNYDKNLHEDAGGTNCS